jgi:hypothetical protein
MGTGKLGSPFFTVYCTKGKKHVIPPNLVALYPIDWTASPVASVHVCLPKENTFILGGFFGFYLLFLRYSTLLLLPPLRFYCVGGCWDRTQDGCDVDIDSQTL